MVRISTYVDVKLPRNCLTRMGTQSSVLTATGVVAAARAETPAETPGAAAHETAAPPSRLQHLWLVHESVVFPLAALARLALTCKACCEFKIREETYAAAFRDRFPWHASLELGEATEFNPAYPSGLGGSFRPGRWMTSTDTTCSGPESWQHVLQVLQFKPDDGSGVTWVAAAPLARQRAQEGGMIQAALRWVKKAPQPEAVLIGLDAAGKTSMMYNLGAAQDPHRVPSFAMTGFNVQDNLLGNLQLREFDLGGQQKTRPLFRHYYAVADAIVFVIDANDADRIPEAARELHAVLNETVILKAPRMPVLIFAAKSDLPNATGMTDLWHAMMLSAFDHGCMPAQFGRFDVCLQPCSNLSGEGLAEGFQWLQSQLPEFKPPDTMKPGQVGRIDSQAKCDFDLTSMCNN